MLKEQSTNYLWDLFRLQFLLADEIQAKQLTSSLYERELELPDEVESLLLLFLKTWDVNYLTEVLKMSVRRYFFDVEKHVILVALLVRERQLTTNEAKDLLLMPGRSVTEFHPSIRHAFDAAWLVNQDSVDGFANSDDDNLLTDALADVLTAYSY